MHSITAARMLGGKAEIYGKGTAERQAAKALNFGIPGGLGAKKMYSYGRENYGLDWSMSEAEELYNAWLEAYDDVDEYLERFRSLGPWELKPEGMTKRQYWQSLNFEDYPSYWEFLMAHDKGRIYDVELPSGMMVPARMFTQSANISFQHLGAVATSHAINKCFQAGLPVIGAVHDAIYLVAPNEKDWTTAFDRGRELEQIMEQALYETCPLAPRQRVEAEIKETFF